MITTINKTKYRFVTKQVEDKGRITVQYKIEKKVGFRWVTLVDYHEFDTINVRDLLIAGR